MPYTRYPKGVSSLGLTVLGSLGGNIPFTFGTYYFVSSVTGKDYNKGLSPNKPLLTVAQALGRSTAGNGDVIVCLPGHAETVSSAAGININKAFTTVVGIGTGSKQPQFTFSTATATIALAAANCTWTGTRLTANFADVATAFTVSAKDATISYNRFDETGTDLNWFSCILTDATNNSSDGLTIVGNTEYSVDAATKAFISILANQDRVLITDNYCEQGSTIDAGHFIIMGSFVCFYMRIFRNILEITGDNNAQATGVFMTGSSTTSTGVCAFNNVSSLQATGDLFDTATLDFLHFDNYFTGVIAKSGYLLPAVDAA